MFSGNRFVSVCYDIVPLGSPQQTYEVMEGAGVLHHELEHITQATNSLKKTPIRQVFVVLLQVEFRDLPATDP